MSFSSLVRWLGVQPVALCKKTAFRTFLGGVFATGMLLVCSRWVFQKSGAEWLVASMGASVVLVIGAPHGPLSQPWPVVGGHTVSALVGVLCAKMIPVPILAAGSAVGLALIVMCALGCLHPPGGATALTAVVAGPHIWDLGFWFAWSPVFLNACTLILLATVHHRFFGVQRYPASHDSKR
jgi:CBS domain-containing membrane protein